jgi:hypothetical protein
MSDDPVPAYFSWRYIFWLLWANAITVLNTIQAVVATLTLDPTLIPHDTLHYLLIANCILCVVVAQLKKNNPPGPPPMKDQSSLPETIK